MILHLNKSYLKTAYTRKATEVSDIPWAQFYRDPKFRGFVAEFDWFSSDMLSFATLCLERGITVRLIDRTLSVSRVYQHTEYILPRDSKQSLSEWGTTKLPLKELRTWQRENNSYLSLLRKNQELYTQLSNMRLELQDTLKQSALLLGKLNVIIGNYPERSFGTQTREDLANTFSVLWDMTRATSTYEVEETILQGLYYLKQGIEPSLSHNPDTLTYNTIGDYVEYAHASEA